MRNTKCHLSCLVCLVRRKIFGMKVVEYTAKLCEGLASNTHIVSLDLEGCSVNDACAAQLAEVLATNKTVQFLNLKGNRIRDEGCVALARAMAANTCVRQVNIFGQEGGRKWGEGTLSEWLTAYATNFTLLNIIWSTSSKQTVRLLGLCAAPPVTLFTLRVWAQTLAPRQVRLTSMTARNNNINRALRDGQFELTMLPEPMRANPPAMAFFKMPDVKATRGGVAQSVNKDRKVSGGGKVRRSLRAHTQLAAMLHVVVTLFGLRNTRSCATGWRTPRLQLDQSRLGLLPCDLGIFHPNRGQKSLRLPPRRRPRLRPRRPPLWRRPPQERQAADGSARRSAKSEPVWKWTATRRASWRLEWRSRLSRSSVLASGTQMAG